MFKINTEGAEEDKKSYGPYFANGPASFEITEGTEGICNNARKSLYVKLRFALKDRNGKEGKLTDCIFDNEVDKYKKFLKAIGRPDLVEKAIHPSMFNGARGALNIGFDEKKGYNCVEDYIENSVTASEGWGDEPHISAGLPKVDEVYADDIPF